MPIYLINCIEHQVLKHLLKLQAVSQSGRSTTEHSHTVFAYKLLAEKAIQKKCIIKKLHIKYFPYRHEQSTLIKNLKQIVEKDELHALKLLPDDTKL